MTRGTYANTRIKNALAKDPASGKIKNHLLSPNRRLPNREP
jgi:hypothetical protein